MTDARRVHPIDAMCARVLTRRQLSVIRFVRMGFSDREIGVILELSESTVRTHRLRAVAKLKAAAEERGRG